MTKKKQQKNTKQPFDDEIRSSQGVAFDVFLDYVPREPLRVQLLHFQLIKALRKGGQTPKNPKNSKKKH